MILAKCKFWDVCDQFEPQSCIKTVQEVTEKGNHFFHRCGARYEWLKKEQKKVKRKGW